MHTHQKTNIFVTDSFIRKFAERYLTVSIRLTPSCKHQNPLLPLAQKT